jgi:3-dehydroquinate synthetase
MPEAGPGIVDRRATGGGAHRTTVGLLGDKKRRAGRQRWIMPMEIGRVLEVDDVTDAELERALRAIGA